MPTFETDFNSISRQSAAALATESVFVLFDSSDQVNVAASGAKASGILRWAVTASGTETTVDLLGPDVILLATFGGTTAIGDELTGDSTGRAVKATQGDWVMAISEQVGASGQKSRVRGVAPYQKGTLKIGKLALVGATIKAGNIGWANPEASDIVIVGPAVYISTKSTGASKIDVGTTAVSATTASDNLLDGLDVGTAAGSFMREDGDAPGAGNGKEAQTLATGKWVTVNNVSGDTTGLVGTLIIPYYIP